MLLLDLIANTASAAATPSAVPMDAPPFSASALYVAGGIIGLIIVASIVLHFVEMWQKVVGKRPAVAVEVSAHTEGDKGGGRLAVDFTGFVATKEFDAHKEEIRLRTLGLEKQISESRHDWQRELQGILALATERDESSMEWRAEISGDMKVTGQKLAAVKQQADMIQATQTNMDAKLDRLVERHIPSPTR